MPGKYFCADYSASLTVWLQSWRSAAFTVIADSTAAMNAEDRVAQQDFQRRFRRLYRAVSGAIILLMTYKRG